MLALRALERRLLRVLAARAEASDFGSYEVELFTDAGLEFALEEQRNRLTRWEQYQPLFEFLRSDPQINRDALGSSFIQNGWYPTPDAEAYAAMIAECRPARIVEVGGGFSTMVARRTLEYLRLDASLCVIDPEPRTDVRECADRLILEKVENVPATEFVRDGEQPFFLFVDSSHVTRAQGDIPYLYNSVIPRLPSGTSVHVHDVFIPYDYPPRYRARLYTEQYVVHALLAKTDAFGIVFAGRFLGHAMPEAMTRAFGATVPSPHGSAAFWFDVT